MLSQRRALAPHCIRAVTAGALIAMSAGVFAANLGFLNNTPVTYMKERDFTALNTAAREALETKKDGESLDWSNKGTGNSVAIHGTITPKESFDDGGLKCRKVELIAIAKGQTQTWTPTACKQASGKWALKKQ